MKKKLLREIYNAWTVRGSNPEYHEVQKEHIRVYWPSLYDAIMNLLSAYAIEEDNVKDKWIIWSIEHTGYWGANRRGYTPYKSLAGIYTYEEALEIVEGANKYLDSYPNEAMIKLND